ncbi:hypothetical protein CN575_21375 [Bacillus wiedmannii]|uniref:AAA family ATPase n=1 Tax=Bacillus wiedmannii TaxID=1890302 RepID=UPI000BF4825A|nr:ATP-binding protein [Bacillus wiedmannii]PEP31649.1 hypothetical protein CN575_21375 [Bacillus wiedmannii]
MYIKSLKFFDHEIYKDLEFNFCDSNGKPYETIILAGENGTGKSTFLNIIYDFINSPIPSETTNGKTKFIFQLSEKELLELKKHENFKSSTQGYQIGNELSITVTPSVGQNSNALETSISRTDEEGFIIFPAYIILNIDIFKSIFSDVDVNYTPNSIDHTTSLDVDMPNSKTTKSTANLAQEVTQLLIDIESLDNGDFSQWADKNPTSQVSEGIRDVRMRRFKNAFESIFPNKKYKKVINTVNGKKILFEEFGKEISINELSSGEKQIVFRGSFLLRNKLATEGAIVLIDEPEISLHPKWQLKILDFYKNLFKNTEGFQTSQLFFATHSPFVIHNDSRSNDKVLVLKRTPTGEVIIPDQGEFFSWTEEQVIKEAFDVNFLQERVKNAPKHLIITEGKTDWKHLSAALNKFQTDGQMNENNFQFYKFEDEIDMGSKNLLNLCDALSKLKNDNKIIAVFDRDEVDTMKKASVNNGENFKNWGNNVYSFTLPIPDHRTKNPNICIEHYYIDEDIKLEDSHLRRLYIGNEFSTTYGLSVDGSKICKNKNKCGENSIQIIDSGVCNITDESINIALSKNNFAQYIYDKAEPFNQVNFESFRPVFRIIQDIINED